MAKTVVQYIRRGYVGEKREFQRGPFKVIIEQTERSPRVGVMVAVGPGKIGWVIKARGEKRNDWRWARELAEQRASDPERFPNPPLPEWVSDQLDYFFDRSMRYFGAVPSRKGDHPPAA